jgi:hypothetical protein
MPSKATPRAIFAILITPPHKAISLPPCHESRNWDKL